MTTNAALGFATTLFSLMHDWPRWQLIEVGLKLKIFDRLPTPRSAEDLAADLDLDAGRLGLVLDGLCALGALAKQDGHYSLTDGGATYLSTDGPLSLRPMLSWVPWMRHRDIGALLRSKEAAPSMDMSDPAFWGRAVASLRAFHRAVGVAGAIDCLESLPIWPRARRFLDMGAGSEVLALTVAERRPDMAVTLLDLPPCAAQMTKALAEAGPFGSRVSVISGDYNDADLGEGYDVIWASLTLYYARDLDAVLTRVRRALAPGGVFVSHHEGLTAERTQPAIHVVNRLITALSGQDVSFDAGEIAASMLRAGFAGVDSRSVETAFGPMVLDIGRTEP